ncbi:MAG: serine/threonine protein kinase [Acidobacteria bacterium]|nr:serine/threonine protein kinase [Acidobacteriota bacterium]
MTLPGLSFTEEERAFLQQRVALFWKVVFLIALIPDAIVFLLDPAGTLFKSGVIMDRLSTLFFGLLWLVCRRGRRPAWLVLALEWVGLGAVSLVVALTGRYLTTEAIAYFAAQTPGTVPGPGLERAADGYMSIMCITGGGLLFALRAALIPSPPSRTLALNLLLGLPYVLVPWFFGPASDGAPPLRTADYPVVGTVTYAIWWAIISVGTTVISHVVFGLRAEVRRARQLGQYTLEGKLGEGGMGVVYRARHGMMRRPTAVKLLKPEHTAETDLKRFEREVQLTARLTHPHTITIYDYGRTPQGVFYYAMELLDGAALDRVVSLCGPLSEARVVSLLYSVAGALAEAHDVGLIHRDIKPANVILCRQGGMDDFPKVVDFGLVKDLEHAGGAGLTRADVVAGTPLYLAPEAVSAPETVGPPADLYSLGAVGYFALTGTNVFGGRTLVEVCSHHLHTPPEPPSIRLGRPVDPELESLILDCLAKDPLQRPAGAHALRRRLERCVAFGEWTHEDAHVWWKEHGPDLSTASQALEDTDLTLTRQGSDPRANG